MDLATLAGDGSHCVDGQKKGCVPRFDLVRRMVGQGVKPIPVSDGDEEPNLSGDHGRPKHAWLCAAKWAEP